MKKFFAVSVALLALTVCLGMLSGCKAEDPFVQTPQLKPLEESEVSEGAQNSEEVTEPENPDFRNVTWGMTAEEVKRSEGQDAADEDNNTIMYDERVAGMDAILVYSFDDTGKLYEAGYVFSEEHTNDNLYIDDYNQLADALTEKYGAPEYNKSSWSDTLYQDAPEDYGLAVSIGHLMYVAKWKTPTTDINLLLHGDNYECSLVILYKSTAYQAETGSSTEGL